MRTMLLVPMLLCLLGSGLSAEPNWQLPTSGERRAADWASWFTVGGSLTLDTLHSWKCPNRGQCFERQAIRDLVTVAISETIKVAVMRKRPCAPNCGSDNPHESMPSEHTALACTLFGGSRLLVAIPLCVSTAALRVLAGKHYPTDTLVGGIIGGTLSTVR